MTYGNRKGTAVRYLIALGIVMYAHAGVATGSITPSQEDVAAALRSVEATKSCVDVVRRQLVAADPHLIVAFTNANQLKADRPNLIACAVDTVSRRDTDGGNIQETRYLVTIDRQSGEHHVVAGDIAAVLNSANSVASGLLFHLEPVVVSEKQVDVAVSMLQGRRHVDLCRISVDVDRPAYGQESPNYLVSAVRCSTTTVAAKSR
jgi:hypothetical protein